MANINVRLSLQQRIQVKLKPAQGIQIGETKKYLWDPSVAQEYVDEAKDWANKTTGTVDDTEYSAKAYAIGGTGTETNNSKYFKEVSQTWAEGDDEEVQELGGDHSSKASAQLSQAYANADFGEEVEDYASTHEVVIQGEKGDKGDIGEKGDTGEQGPKGDDATINGVKSITINTTGGITSSQSGSTFSIDGSGKPAVISDLETIRSNANSGKSASDTISTYGNIVTHNTGEFATSEQGLKADSALQQNNNVSLLYNDADYRNGTQVGTAVSVHNTSNVAHDDIRQKVQTAEDIAKGRAKSEVFDTFADMETWLKDVVHKGTHNVGDNLYIKAQNVSDYWISAVLTSADPVTGYYYTINKLEAERPDLSNMVTTNTAQTITGNKDFTGNLQKNGNDVATETYVNNHHDSTKYDASNPSGYQTAGQVSSSISTALTGYATQVWVGQQGYITSAVDDSSTTSTTKGWSASKLNGIIGNIETALDTIRGV